MARPPFNAQPVREGPRANQDITVDRILLIDHLGEKHGEVSVQRGLELAAEAGLDLVEVSPNAKPPVCKILDLGKLKYENQKKQNIQRKKQKTIDIKEVKMRPGIEEHDYEVKRRNMVRFLGDGDKVKVTLRFRGREMAHQELGLKVLDRVRDDLDELAKVEQMPKMEGRQMVMVMAPR